MTHDLAVAYLAGIIPAACLNMARGVWLIKHREQHLTFRAVLAASVAVGIIWPLALLIVAEITVSEWTHRDGWIDRYINYMERKVKGRDGDR